MIDPVSSAMIVAGALAGLVVVARSSLKAWHEWLELQRLALVGRGEGASSAAGAPAARIELADLKERVRKLEAIAAGVDL